VSDRPTRVVDASALLAFLLGESGADIVETGIEESAVSTVNWSEVCQRALARGVDTTGLRPDVEALGITLEPFTADDAERAAALWESTRGAGLSLGDRACLALALRLDVGAVTADRAWLELDVGVDVSAIR
jgi:PIN domain nuclease of toxin-antitoxin system